MGASNQAAKDLSPGAFDAWVDGIISSLGEPVASPEAFGAVGDGSTNDLDAFTAMVAQASSGDVIRLSAGKVYNLETVADFDTVITLPAGVHLVGEPGSVLQIDSGNADGPIMVEAGNGSIIEGVTFDMRSKSSSIAVQANAKSNVLIRGCTFTNATIHVYLVGAASDVTVNGCRFFGASYGVLTHDDSTATRINITGNTFRGGSNRDAIALNTPTGAAVHWNIVGNMISGYASTGAADGFGISIARGRGVNIVGNYIYSCTNHGIHIEDGSKEVTILGNTIYDCAKSAIYMVSGSGAGAVGQIKIVGNTIRSCGTSGGQAAIWAEWSGSGTFDGVTISQNQLFDNGKVGVALCTAILQDGTSAAVDWIVTDNTIFNQLGDGASNKGRGIDITGGVHARIAGNVIDGCSHGILCKGAWGGGLVESNNVVGCSTTPISNTSSSTAALVRGNLGHDNTLSVVAISANTATPNAFNSTYFTITGAAANTAAWNLANPSADPPNTGVRVVFDIKNSTGGTLGNITWGNKFLLAGAFTKPADTKRRTISFIWDGTNYVEMDRAAADI